MNTSTRCLHEHRGILVKITRCSTKSKAMEKNYKTMPNLVIPTKYYPVIEDMPEYDLGKVFKMLFVYCMRDDQLQYRYQQMFEMYNSDPHIRQLFKVFKIELDRQIEKYDAMYIRNVKNGRKGGRPRKGKTIGECSADELLKAAIRVAKNTAAPATNTDEQEIAPPEKPFYYENYPSISTATYWDYQIS